MSDLDTQAKRLSGINVSSPWRAFYPIPDGTIDQSDRQVAAFLYSGISASAGTTTVSITIGGDENITPAELVAGNITLQITLTGGATWITAGAGFNDWKPNILAGFTSNQNEAFGWNLYYLPTVASTIVTRDDDTTVTLTWPAGPDYAITIQEIITWTAVTDAIDLNGTTLGTPNTWTITPEVPVAEVSQGGGTSKRDKRLARKYKRVIRFSDLDERERQEALAAIQTRPFTPLEKAAVVLGEADEDDMEDDEILLMAAMRVLH